MNTKGILLFILVMILPYYSALATATDAPDTLMTFNTALDSSTTSILTINNQEIRIISKQDSLNTATYKRKKRIAAILSFPFPFGLLGLHRVFLGTKPYIPFVYIGTLGGCFLILPIIDFIAILSADEEAFRKFENNPKVFMWSH